MSSIADRGTRQVHRAQARVVVLCAGAIETLRILLHSGVGNSSGRLGRFVMDHVMTGVGGPDEGGAEPPAPAIPTTSGRPPASRSRGATSACRAASGAAEAPGTCSPTGGCSPRGENRVTLHPRATDAWGVPVARIDCAHSPADSALAATQLQTMRELAAAAGLTVRTPPSGRPLESLAFRLARSRLVLAERGLRAGQRGARDRRGGHGRGPERRR